MDLVLLTSYEPPARYPLMLGADDSSAWLHAYLALWHPCALLTASGPPAIKPPYEYESPTEGHLFALPETPAAYLHDGWDDDVRTCGSAAFRSADERAKTLDNLRVALEEAHQPWVEWSRDDVHRFAGIGLAYLTVDVLYTAMEHEKLLDAAGFWADVQAAAADPAGARPHLEAAAGKLLSAREVLYPVAIYWLEFWLLPENEPAPPPPAALQRGAAVNVIASARALERLGRERPADVERLRERLASDAAELCGALDHERPDSLLLLESQLWTLRAGQRRAVELVGKKATAFARLTSDAQPATPLLLQQSGISRALLIAFDEARLPSQAGTAVQWPSPDGRQVEALTRSPLPADDPQTYFHLAHHLYTTIAQDSAATLTLRHGATPAGPWADDLLALAELAPVLGSPVTLGRYFADAPTAEYVPASAADEFSLDCLEARSGANHPRAVTGFARQARLRRRLDAGLTYAALLRTLGGSVDLPADLEDRFERSPDASQVEVETFEQAAGQALAARLLARSPAAMPGLLLLNPCGFARRVALERDDFTGPLAVAGPVRAGQADRGSVKIVVDVPPLGYAWLPRGGSANAAGSASGDSKGVRNEFFDAEIDPATGGLRGLREPRSRGSRVGQQLVYGPGGRAVGQEIIVLSAGPALAEVVSVGSILDEQDRLVCGFRQRFRAWSGRPLLELRIELFPERPLEGYPWHAFLGARFAWRDAGAALSRGVLGRSWPTAQTRPQSGEFLELRGGPQCVTLFPGGLPFHQRHGARMLDVLLRTPGETAQVFDLALGIDRERPAQLAFGLLSPVLALPVDNGPPPAASGWLMHCDAPNLLLTGLRPVGDQVVEARLLECSGFTGAATLRLARDPASALLVDADGQALTEAAVTGDAVAFDTEAYGMTTIRVEL